MPAAKSLIGLTFGDLEVTARAGKNASGGWDWVAQCTRGRSVIISSSAIRRRKSCGCRRIENQIIARGQTPHGLSHSSEHGIWVKMRQRCGHLPSGGGHPRYAGRGITVCARWRNSFVNFFEDMGSRPSPRHTLDRIDNDANYEPGNCRWALPEVQANNRSTNLVLDMGGKAQTLSEWCKELSLNKACVHHRLVRGASVAEALQPVPPRTSIHVSGRGYLSIAQCAVILGITRTSAYRLHRSGGLEGRLATSLA